MRCPQCGTENPAGKIVCRNCGTRLRVGAGGPVVLGAISEEELMRRVRVDMRKLIVVTGISIVFGVVLGFLIR